MAVLIQPAQAEQLTALTQLLERNHLLTDDLPDGLPNFWLAFVDEQLIGSVGLEPYGSIGLLRSVCVDNDYRNQGIARHLCNMAWQAAQQQRLDTIYLLTTTADAYFSRLGFECVDRLTVPDAIQQTRQFSGLCPSSAVVMKQSCSQ